MEGVARYSGAQVQAKVYSKEGQSAGEERTEYRRSEKETMGGKGTLRKKAPCGSLGTDTGFYKAQPAMIGHGFPEAGAIFPHLFLKLA